MYLCVTYLCISVLFQRTVLKALKEKIIINFNTQEHLNAALT